MIEQLKTIKTGLAIAIDAEGFVDKPVRRALLDAVKAAAQLEAMAGPQEPVAWMVTSEQQDGTRSTYPLSGRYKDVRDACDFGEPVPLYAAPVAQQPQAPLTVAQITHALRAEPMVDNEESFVRGIRAAERHHGIVGKEGA